MERHVPKDPEADHAEWQLFFEEGDMRVFKRDSEENGMIIYPVKVVTKVKVSLSIIYISIAHLNSELRNLFNIIHVFMCAIMLPYLNTLGVLNT